MGTILVVILFMAPVFAETVCKFYNGDRFTLCSGTQIKLACVEAPEAAQQYGNKAKDALRTLVQGQEVTLKCVGKYYKRDVCFAQVNGQDIGMTMVSSGNAFAYPVFPYCEDSKATLTTAEKSAEESHKGVWTLAGGGVRPWDFRHDDFARNEMNVIHPLTPLRP